jgi:hypothetical protein
VIAAERRQTPLCLLPAHSSLETTNKHFNAATALEALQPHSAEALYWSIQANELLASNPLRNSSNWIRLAKKPRSSRRHLPPA